MALVAATNESGETEQVTCFITPKTKAKLEEQALKGDATLTQAVKVNQLIVDALRKAGFAELY